MTSEKDINLINSVLLAWKSYLFSVRQGISEQEKINNLLNKLSPEYEFSEEEKKVINHALKFKAEVLIKQGVLDKDIKRLIYDFSIKDNNCEGVSC